MGTTYKVLGVVFAGLLACGGCSVPGYDVDYTKGRPTVSSVTQRIECELTDLVRGNPSDPGRVRNPDTDYEWPLLDLDYDVQVTLSLDVNETGSLAPSITFMEPVTALISFALGGSATLSESRDHKYSDNFQYSMRKLYADARLGRGAPECAKGETILRPDKTPLAGDLGIRDFVAMGVLRQRVAIVPAVQPATSKTRSVSPPAAPSGTAQNATNAFGGTITFVVTKNVSGVGPTWTTTRWKGPGGLLGLAKVNTDSITVSFAQGPNAGRPVPLTPGALAGIVQNGPNLGAYNFTQQQLVQSINSQLGVLLNQPP